MKRLLVVLVLWLHLALICVCFGAAILHPDQSAPTPMIVYFADLPASYFFMHLRDAFTAVTPNTYIGRLLIDASFFCRVRVPLVAWGSLAAWEDLENFIFLFPEPACSLTGKAQPGERADSSLGFSSEFTSFIRFCSSLSLGEMTP